jgi:hypothetical protein
MYDQMMRDENELFSDLTEALRVAYAPYKEKIKQFYDRQEYVADHMPDNFSEDEPLNTLAAEIHLTALEHGWWETERSFPEVIALIHSELSEALESYRSDEPIIFHCCNESEGCRSKCAPDDLDECPEDVTTCGNYSRKPEGAAVELADTIIRILDWCGHEGIDIDAVVREKMLYNKTRPYRHGNKRA